MERQIAFAADGRPAPRRRTLLTHGLIGGFALLSPAGRVVAAPSDAIRVSATGRAGTVTTLGEALSRAAMPGASRLILIEPGLYDEKLSVTVPGVTIAGMADGVVLSHAAAASPTRPDGGRWGTSGSATLTIAAPGVTLARLTIRNAHDFLRDRTQAVALAIGTEADRCRVLDCVVEGWQDTLLIQARTFIDRCRVSGCVDFVFGGGAAWIARSTIVSRHVPGGVGPAEGGGGGFIAAPSTPAVQPWGLVFADCRLEREAGLPDGGTWLGRPWRAGGNMALTGHAAFLRCWMDAHIAANGWTSMGYRGPDGTRRLLTPGEARLWEARSRGPGARQGAGRRQITPAIYARMTPVTILDGWRATNKNEEQGRLT